MRIGEPERERIREMRRMEYGIRTISEVTGFSFSAIEKVLGEAKMTGVRKWKGYADIDSPAVLARWAKALPSKEEEGR
jgi:hypothetical protein